MYSLSTISTHHLLNPIPIHAAPGIEPGGSGTDETDKLFTNSCHELGGDPTILSHIVLIHRVSVV